MKVIQVSSSPREGVIEGLGNSYPRIRKDNAGIALDQESLEEVLSLSSECLIIFLGLFLQMA